MTREEFVKQRCEIDKITEEEFEKIYRVVKCNCGEPYCKGYRCLNLDDLLKENQELKKQLKELEEHSVNAINKQVSRGIDLVNQQKEFIEYLEKTIVDSKAGSGQQYYYQQVLEMYKEIIGDDK